jgi:hypothetical protein
MFESPFKYNNLNNKYPSIASGPLVYGLLLTILVASPETFIGILNYPSIMSISIVFT